MVGGIHTDFLVAATLLFLTLTMTPCRAENETLLVTLPDWRTNSEYIAQCSYDRNIDLLCDWTRRQQRTEDVAVDILESGPLGLEGEACLEFWYLANGSGHRALLKSSAGLVELWASPATSRNVWRQVFVPLNVTEPATQVALEEESTEEGLTFNHIGVRRGVCGPQCETNTELWTDESTRCLCSAGQLSCAPSQCPKGRVCAPQRGGSAEIPTSGTCTIHAHTDCSTFDGALYRLEAPCTYVLAKTCSATEGLSVFSVEVAYEQKGISSVSAVQQVTVSTGPFRVSLLKEETRRVVVNGVWRKLPLNLRGGTVNITGNPAAVQLGTSFGLSVSYDSAGAVHVTVPSSYARQVCGLCGNLNHAEGDDALNPNGTVPQAGPTLAPRAVSSCDTVLVPHQCTPLQEAEYASEPYCGALLSNNGPFAECQSVLGAKSYFRACVLSMCTTHGDPAVLCETLQTYADICQKAKVNVPRWRNSTFCSLQCGENSHYNSCADGCPEVCSSMDHAGSCGRCEERCECESGFTLSGGKCVPSGDCGCWYDEKHYEKGAAFVKGDCVQQCLCLGNNDVQCNSMQCAQDQVCKVKDGVKGCFGFAPATCSVYGDPHYITFDGLAYDFQGGCSYTLATTCGGGTSVRFTVIGHNTHPPLQNFTRSKLEAVTLRVEDLNLTLNQSGDVYLNNSIVQLPYTARGTFGSVTIYLKNNYVTMETTFGIQMMVDGQNRLFLQVDEHYKYELCGLCGTYSGHQGDDFVTPGGQTATEPFDFGNSWRVQDSTECTAYPNHPRVCDYDQENEAYDQCYTLLGEAFKPCHELIHPSIYISSCVYDYCATNGELHSLCESFKSYAAACQVAGEELPPWQPGTACAESTTPATPATATPALPTPDQTFCPMNCDFENNLCGWHQLIQDSFDWTRHSGATPSNLTGPNEDHTTGAGFYLYIEGNDATHGDSARLLSSTCHYDGPLCLHFWYHVYGSATAMALNIYLLKSNKATKVWSIMNNQVPQWHPGYVDISISGPFEVIVEGIRGSNDQSDVAVDDISIHFGSCSDNFPALNSQTVQPFTTADVLPSHPVCKMDCDFEQALCDWGQTPTDAFDWTRQSGSTPTMTTGPSSDHTTGSGHYLYIEASSVTHGDTARLISTECPDPGPQCLQFWYHMYGSADTMGLHVYLYQDRMASSVWRKRNDQGNVWHRAHVDITTTGAFQIIFEGRRGSTDLSDVAIDDIKLYRGVCSDLNGDVTTQPEKPHQNATTTENVPVPSTAAPETPVITTTPQTPVMIPTTTPLVEATANTENNRSTTLQTPKPGLHITAAENVSVPPTAAPETPVITATPQTPVMIPTTHPLVEATANTENNRSTTLQTPKPDLHITAAENVSVPPTAAPETPVITATPQPFMLNASTPPLLEANMRNDSSLHLQTAASCPEHSHYTTCVPVCSPTCAHLSGPPGCSSSNSTCAPGCACDRGFALQSRLCVPVRQCGCVDGGGGRHPFGEVWYSHHCSQRCQCEKDGGEGKVACASTDTCQGSAVCLQNHKGDFYCQPTDFSECTLKGDDEYNTFDQLQHGFRGEQSYVLVQTKNLPHNVPDVTIVANFTRRADDDDRQQPGGGGSSSEEDHSSSASSDGRDEGSDEREERRGLQQLTIRVYNHTVAFQSNWTLAVDGKVTDTPVSPTSGLNIQTRSSRFYLETDFGLSVEFDGHSSAKIILPHIYKRKVGGLCGNFDGQKWNDQTKPDGTRPGGVQEFGQSWQV